MKIFVAGATGVLGRALVPQLVAQDPVCELAAGLRAGTRVSRWQARPRSAPWLRVRASPSRLIAGYLTWAPRYPGNRCWHRVQPTAKERDMHSLIQIDLARLTGEDSSITTV
jgi:hypothetical protein